jgi:ATP-dependent helicase HrpA
MAAELVETNRLWARIVAPIQPEWAERLAGDLVKRSYGEAQWDPQRGSAVCLERATLFGLPIVAGRRVGYDRIDPRAARELFIRHALVAGEWSSQHPFAERNRALVERLEKMGDRLRRSNVVDEELFVAAFDARVPGDAVSARHFERWWRDTRLTQPDLLDLTVADLVRADVPVPDPGDYPAVWVHDGVELALTYRYAPGAPDDGVTVHVPLAILDQISPAGFDWGVPGWRAELVAALVKTLPKDVRRLLVPAGDTVRAAVERLEGADPGAQPITDALAATLSDQCGERVLASTFDVERLPPHLRVTFAVDDEHGDVIATGKDLVALRAALGRRHRAAVAAAAPIAERRGITAWDLGTIPTVVESERNGTIVRGYPALLDDGDSVSLRVFTRPELQQRVMRAGVRRLLLLAVAPSRRHIERRLPNQVRLALVRLGASSADALVDDCLTACADQLVDDAGELPRDEEAFASLVRTGRAQLAERAAAAARAAGEIVVLAADLAERLERPVVDAARPAVVDMRAQLARLVRPRFVTAGGVRRLPDVLRYLRAIERRLDKVAADAARDRQRMSEVEALERRYGALVSRLDPGELTAEIVELGWSFEELRVSMFAQALGARGGVSAIKLDRQLARLGA